MLKAINTDVTGRDDWERASFDVLTTGGLCRVEGLVRGLFGIHEGVVSWTLTHLPTGVRLSFADELPPLICLVAKIKGLADWDFTDNESWVQQDRSAIGAAIDECDACRPNGDAGWDAKLAEVTAS